MASYCHCRAHQPIAAVDHSADENLQAVMRIADRGQQFWVVPKAGCIVKQRAASSMAAPARRKALAACSMRRMAALPGGVNS